MISPRVPLPDHPPAVAALLRATAHPDLDVARDAWDLLVREHGDAERSVSWIRAGGQQRLLPLLAERADELALPASVRAACDDAVTGAWGLNERLLGEAGPVLAALIGAGIPVTALKGLALLGDVYPQHPLRPLGDVDVWVPAARGFDALAIAADLGWRPPHGPATAQPGPFLRVRSHAATLCGPIPGPTIDLHWRPVKVSPLRALGRSWPAELLEQVPAAHPLSASGLRRPRAELLLVQLAAHGVRPDNVKIVHWVVDLHRLMREHPAMDVALIVRLAHDLDVRLHVQAGLRTVTELLGVALPAALSGAPAHLGDCRPSRARDEVRRWDASRRAQELDGKAGLATRVRKLWAMVRSQTTTRGVAAFIQLMLAGSLAVAWDRSPVQTLRRRAGRASTSTATPRRR